MKFDPDELPELDPLEAVLRNAAQEDAAKTQTTYDRIRDLYSGYVFRKAKKLLEESKVIVTDQRGVYRVGGGGGVYRVQVLEPTEPSAEGAAPSIPLVSCSCTNGQNTGSGRPSCYHSAAVLLAHLPGTGFTLETTETNE